MGSSLNTDRNNIPPLWRAQFAITPSDTVDLDIFSHGIEAMTAGTVTIVTPDGTAVQRTVIAGQMIGHVLVRRVNATGTTATVVGGY